MLYVVDLSSLVFRAWHAAGDDQPAAYPVRVVRSQLLELGRKGRVVVCCDSPGKTWRHDAFAGYKSDRVHQDRDPQVLACLDEARRNAEADGFACLRKPAFEADDLIAAMVHHESGRTPVCIVSQDKDLMQLVSDGCDGDGVVIQLRMRGDDEAPFDEAAVVGKFGVPPCRVGDFLALVGDSSDSIPGVTGVGPKKAAALLDRFGSLDGIGRAVNADEAVISFTPALLRNLREAFAETPDGSDIELARRLIALDCSALTPEECAEAVAGRPVQAITNDQGFDDMTTTDSTPDPEPTQPGNVAPMTIDAEPISEPAPPPRAMTVRSDYGYERALEPQDIREAYKLACSVVESRMWGGGTNPNAALAIIHMGRSLGIDSWAALRGIHVIKGKPVLSAQLMVALVMRSPHCEYWQVVDPGTERCVIETKRRNHPNPDRGTFTLDDADRAGLLKNDNWRKYPRAMLQSRAAAELARRVYPDVVANMYVEGEL